MCQLGSSVSRSAIDRAQHIARVTVRRLSHVITAERMTQYTPPVIILHSAYSGAITPGHFVFAS